MAAEASDLAKSSAKITKVIGRAYAAQVRPHLWLRMPSMRATASGACVLRTYEPELGVSLRTPRVSPAVYGVVLCALRALPRIL